MNSDEKNTNVIVDGQSAGSANVKVPVRRTGMHQVVFRRKGYLDRVEYLFPYKVNGWGIGDAYLTLGLALLVETPLDMNHKLNTRKLEGDIMTPIPRLPKETRTLFCNPVEMSVKNGHLLGQQHALHPRDNSTSKTDLVLGEEVEASSEGFTHAAYQALLELELVEHYDSAKSVFESSAKPMLTLEAEVIDITATGRLCLPIANSSQLRESGREYRRNGDRLDRRVGAPFLRLESDVKVRWKILNRLEEVICEKTTVGRRVYYNFDLQEDEKDKKEIVIGGEERGVTVIERAFQHALFHFLADRNTYDAIKARESDLADEAEAFSSIKLPAIESAKVDDKTIAGATDAVVTIKMDEKHGSGCIVSSNGYILTNHHVTSGLEEVQVLLGEEEYTGKVVRSHTAADLSLVKIEASGLAAIAVNLETEAGLGEDVFSIGTSADINLGQTVSKGIISGRRTIYGIEMLQTDVSINAGSSGGALVGQDGRLVGVVNSKLVGVGVEGIGFAIPAKTVMEKLKLEYE